MPNATKHEIVSEIVDLHLSAGNPIRFWVTSNSMKPMLQIGDAVIAETADLKELKTGDVIIIKREDDYLTHRLISKSRKKWITKGDNNIMPDHSARKDIITGRVNHVQRSEKMIDLRTHKWQAMNPLMARISFLEWKFFLVHRYLRLPFRLAIKTVQKYFMP